MLTEENALKRLDSWKRFVEEERKRKGILGNVNLKIYSYLKIDSIQNLLTRGSNSGEQICIVLLFLDTFSS